VDDLSLFYFINFGKMTLLLYPLHYLYILIAALILFSLIFSYLFHTMNPLTMLYILAAALYSLLLICFLSSSICTSVICINLIILMRSFALTVIPCCTVYSLIKETLRSVAICVSCKSFAFFLIRSIVEASRYYRSEAAVKEWSLKMSA